VMMQTVLALLLVISLATHIVHALPITPHVCAAYEDLPEGGWEEEWLFGPWQNATQSYTTSAYNVGAMQGNFTYKINFCNTVELFMGDPASGPVFGWNFGVLTNFDKLDVSPNTTFSNRAFREFFQEYSFGDAGAPCVNGQARSALVNLYCARNGSFGNCTSVPSAGGRASCLVGNPNTSYCLCSVQFNASTPASGLCNGLILNTLSNICPEDTPFPLVPVTPTNPVQNAGQVIGVVILVLVCLIIVFFLGGTVINCCTGKRGISAVPCVATCAKGSDDEATYPAPAPRESYGTAAAGYQAL